MTAHEAADTPDGPESPESPDTGLEIAVVGMAGRFPGAGSVAEYWDLIRTGTAGIRRFTAEETGAAGIDPDAAGRADHVPAGGVLDDAELFDAGFFGYTPRDAALLDPQQRVFLETAWHAMESAALIPGDRDHLVGVYAGASISGYLLHNLLPNHRGDGAVGGSDPADLADLVLANDKDTLASRVAYHLDLRGPAVTVQTGCSTSLVAVHLAVQALLARDCDIALAGGVSVRPPQTAGYRYTDGGILSPDGRCRPFDATAAGTVGGNGVGVVVLRPLADALRAGDPVHAVILGTAVNNDGTSRVGFTAPGVDGQAAVIRAAHDVAGVDPTTIGYVEAHGTGTLLGDPIEVAALSSAFGGGPPWCALGSVKALIGHLDAAAGIAGFIKAVLAVREATIPPSPHLDTPNPELDLERSPFHIPTTTGQWPAGTGPRRAGVSSFGMGGTNAHAVIEQVPPPAALPAAALPTEGAEPLPDRSDRLVVLSARTPQALAASAEELGRYLQDDQRRPDGISLTDVAHTLRTGRRALPHRAAVVCADLDTAAARLLAGDRVLTGPPAPDRPADVVFMFPGQGAQHALMAAGVYRAEPVFAARLDDFAAVLRPHLDTDLLDLVSDPGADDMLAETRYTQPALFAVEYALADLWRAWGVRPAAMIGHSVGEYVAAALAGVMDPADALELVAARGRLLHELPPGAMLSVRAAASDVRDLLDIEPGGVALAADNAPDLCVLSGPIDRVAALEAELSRRGVEHGRLHTTRAFHSPMTDPILDRFGDLVARVTLRPPELPVVSGVTGEPLTAEEATDPVYWVRQLRGTVQFGAGLRSISVTDRPTVLLEVGPGRTLVGLAGRNITDATGPSAIGPSAIGSLPHPASLRQRRGERPDDAGNADVASMLTAAGRLWTAGVPVAPDPVGKRIELPGYRFARTRHWIEPPAPTTTATPTAATPTTAATAADQSGPASVAPAAPAESAESAESVESVESVVRSVWQELLGIENIPTDADFFELGGHSLLATRIAARLGDRLGTGVAAAAVFEAPTIAGLVELIERDAPAPADPDAAKGGDADDPSTHPGHPTHPGRSDRLTPAEERLWFLDRLDPGNPAYNIAFGLRINGPLDPDALRIAIDAIVDRHDALRSSFPVDTGPIGDDGDGGAGRPVRVVRDRVRLPLAVTDLSSVPLDRREAEAARLATELAGHRFDLAEGPPIDVTLLDLGESALLVVTAHHIAFDGWSTAVFIEELAAHYTAAITGEPADVAELPVSVTDWADRHRAETGAGAEQDLAYWRGELAAAPVLSTFPTDLPRPTVQRNRGGHHRLRLDAESTERLDRFARESGVTLNAVVLAGLAAILRHATDADDLLIGTPTAGRPNTTTEPLIGCFADTFVLRFDLSGDPTARELVRRVHATIRRATAHPNAPYTAVVDAVAPPRAPGHNPLFQIMCSLAAIGTPPRTAGHRDDPIRITTEPVEVGGTDFDMFCTLERHDGGLDGRLDYNTDLYLPGTAAHIAEALIATVGDLAEDPDRPVSAAPSLHTTRVTIAATFTPDPIAEPVDFWLRLLRAPVRTRIAPYGQVVQHLLADPDAADTGPDDLTVCLIRWEDWLRHLTPDAGDSDLQSQNQDPADTVLERAFGDLLGGLEHAARTAPGRLIVGICPPSRAYRQQPWAARFARLDDRLAAAARDRLGGVPVLGPTSWTDRYPVVAIDDRRADALGHVPYTPEFFAAAGTHLVRHLSRRWRPPVRTVLVDPAIDPAVRAAVTARQAGYGRTVLDLPADPAAPGTPTDQAGCLVLTADRATANRLRPRFGDALTVAVDGSIRTVEHIWPLDAPLIAGELGAPGESAVPAVPAVSAVSAGRPVAAFDAHRVEHIAHRLNDAGAILDRVARHRVVALGSGRTDGADDPVSARTPTEAALAKLWREVLPGAPEPVDVRQDFFAAGGHSLLATRLLSRVQTELGRDVELYTFFTGPTIEALAAALDSDDGAAAEPIPPLPAGVEPVPAPAQRRLWAVGRLDGHTGDASANQNGRHAITVDVTVTGALDTGAVRTAVAALVRRHDALRTRFPDHHGLPQVVIADTDTDAGRADEPGSPAGWWWPPVDATGADELARLVHQHATVPYDVGCGPLLRVRIVRTAPDEHHLLLGMHHLISDHASWSIFLRELAALYGEHAGGPPAGLAPLPIRFVDYAAWHADRLAGPDLAEHTEFWRGRLAGAPPESTMPATRRGVDTADLADTANSDAPAPGGTGRADRVEHTFGAGLSAAMRQSAAEAGSTLFTVLLAGFGSLLRRACGQDEIVIGTPIAGRDRPETEPLIGYFADLLPLRLDMSGDPTFADLLSRVHRDVPIDRGHAGLPFGSIVRAARPARTPGRHPLFQCVLNVVEEAGEPPSLGGLPMTVRDVPAGDTDFDLFVTVAPDADSRLRAVIDYDTGRYTADDVTGLAADLDGLLTAATADPGRRLDELCPRMDRSTPEAAPIGVAVAASFTAEPLRPAADYWFGRLGVPARLAFGPYAQVLAQLFDPDAVLGADPTGANVVLFRWEDWLRHASATIAADDGGVPPPKAMALLEGAWHELATAIGAFTARSDRPLTLAVCPASDRFARPPWAGVFAALTDRFHRLCAGLDNAEVLPLDRWLTRFGVTGISDSRSDELGHIPYTTECYSVIGTALAAHVGSRVEPAGDRPLDTIDTIAAALGGSCTGEELTRLVRPAHRPVNRAPDGPDTDAAPEPATATEATLAGIWADLLRQRRISVHDDFFELGGDSMLAIQVVSRAADAGIGFTPRQLVEHPTIAALAACADASAGGPKAATERRPDGLPVGPVPLTPPQAWFFDHLAPTLPNPSHFNHPYYLRLLRPVAPEVLARALAVLGDRHDALGMCFRPGPAGERYAEPAPGEAIRYTVHDLAGSTPDDPEVTARLEELAGAAQADLDLAAGPLVRAVHFRFGGDHPERLLIACHHLVVDAMSRGVLLADLQTLCRQLSAGAEPSLPPAPVSYRAWADRLDTYVASGAVDGELDFWLAQAAPDARLDVDFACGVAAFGSADTVSATLDDLATGSLKDAGRAAGTGLGDLVAAVVAAAVSEWTGGAECALALAGHGRADLFDDLDPSRTVGWFQVYYPLRFSAPGDLADSLARLRAVPAGGIGYGLLRYLHPDRSIGRRLAGSPPPQVTFNYMGDFGFSDVPAGDELFGVVDAPSGPPQHPEGRWPYLLDVVPQIADGRLRIDLNYNHTIHRSDTAARLLSDLVQRLKDIAMKGRIE